MKKAIFITLITIGVVGASLGCIPIMLVGVVGLIYGVINYEVIDWGEDDD